MEEKEYIKKNNKKEQDNEDKTTKPVYVVMPSEYFDSNLLIEAVNIFAKEGNTIYVDDSFPENSVYDKNVEQLRVKDKKNNNEELYRLLSNKNTRILFTLETEANHFAKMKKKAPILNKIESIKNKASFLSLVNTILPKAWYQEVSIKKLKDMEMPKSSLFLRPLKGFGSKGCVAIENKEEWKEKVSQAISDAQEGEKVFGSEVVDSTRYLLTDIYPGEEYAADVFFTEKGEISIVGIYKHLFRDNMDKSDQTYITSKEIMQEMMPHLEYFLKKLIKRAQRIAGIALHLEFKYANTKQKIQIIEGNVCRFGGYGLVHLAAHAYGINPFLLYFRQECMDWKNILSERDNTVWTFVLAQHDKKKEDGKHFSMWEAAVKRLGKPLTDITLVKSSPYVMFSAIFACKNIEEAKRFGFINFNAYVNVSLTLDDKEKIVKDGIEKWYAHKEEY